MDLILTFVFLICTLMLFILQTDDIRPRTRRVFKVSSSHSRHTDVSLWIMFDDVSPLEPHSWNQQHVSTISCFSWLLSVKHRKEEQTRCFRVEDAKLTHQTETFYCPSEQISQTYVFIVFMFHFEIPNNVFSVLTKCSAYWNILAEYFSSLQILYFLTWFIVFLTEMHRHFFILWKKCFWNLLQHIKMKKVFASFSFCSF